MFSQILETISNTGISDFTLYYTSFRLRLRSRVTRIKSIPSQELFMSMPLCMQIELTVTAWLKQTSSQTFAFNIRVGCTYVLWYLSSVIYGAIVRTRKERLMMIVYSGSTTRVTQITYYILILNVDHHFKNKKWNDDLLLWN